MEYKRPSMVGNKNRESHGLHKSPEYCSWQSMKTRCTNVNHKHYHRYGGRGIKYDSSWEIFINFYNDMGKRPDGFTLERIDNSKWYSKENCKWASRKEQSRNTKSNVYVTFNNQTKCVLDWAKETGINYQIISKKIKLGFTPEKIFQDNKEFLCSL